MMSNKTEPMKLYSLITDLWFTEIGIWKNEIRTASSKAQFLIIRTSPSLAVILYFGIATIDLTSAFLQWSYFPRNIYKRPQKP